MIAPVTAQQKPQPSGDSSIEAVAAHEEGLSSAFAKGASWVLLVYFGARLLFFALDISAAVPPDETTHAGLCRIFSKTFLLPDNSPETYEFGLVTNTPWLYYWMMGKLLHLNVTGLSDLVFLRLLNIPLAFGTVWYSLRLLRLLTEDRLARLLLLVVMTNTAMFSLLSASVSYDNLTNLLAAMAIFYLFAFFRRRAAGDLVAFLLSVAAGTLTKMTFLPLGLALGVLLLVHEARRLPALPAALRQSFRRKPRAAVLAGLALLVALGLNLQLYGGNYLNYGTLNPGLPQVVSEQAAMQHRLDARGMIFSRFKEGKISYMDALILAGEIKHPGDKADTFYLLMNYQKLRQNPQLWMGPAAYVRFWFEAMLATIFGIKAHLQMLKPSAYMVPVYVVPALAALGFLVRWRPRDEGWPVPALAGIALFYAVFLMYEVNYDAYLAYGEPGLTLYGRYLFIVMAPTAVLTSIYLLRLFRSPYLRNGLAAAVALLFIGYDFPWFVAHATPEWFTWLPV